MHAVPLTAAEREPAFALYRESLYTPISQTFGWDEAFQRDRFANHYPLTDLAWMAEGLQRLGLISQHRGETDWHLHLLLILPQWRGQGVGSRLLRQLQTAAGQRSLNLSCFRCEPRVLAFYLRQGFVQVGSEPDFHLLRWQATDASGASGWPEA